LEDLGVERGDRFVNLASKRDCNDKMKSRAYYGPCPILPRSLQETECFRHHDRGCDDHNRFIPGTMVRGAIGASATSTLTSTGLPIRSFLQRIQGGQGLISSSSCFQELPSDLLPRNVLKVSMALASWAQAKFLRSITSSPTPKSAPYPRKPSQRSPPTFPE
jgi:hypothetical protein